MMGGGGKTNLKVLRVLPRTKCVSQEKIDESGKERGEVQRVEGGSVEKTVQKGDGSCFGGGKHTNGSRG